MIHETPPRAGAAEPSLAGLLDQICDRFETAYKSPTPPRLEDFVSEMPASAAERGFRELLQLDLAYRGRAGQTPSADEYRSRFPQHSATIDELLQPPGLRSPAASPFADTISARMAGSFSDVVAADTQLAPGGTTSQSVGTTTSSGLRFRVIRKHAKGGLGEVFIAEDLELPREVALKQIQSRYADDVGSRTRFVLEAEVTGALEHPGIVPVYGLGKYADGRPFYAMRFIHGDSLKDAIDSFHDTDMGPQTPGERALELRKLLGRFVDVCDAIEYAHSRGIIHRDLKPGNIMLGKFGETLVVDWGLAKPIDRPDLESDPEETEAPTKPMLLSGDAATRMGSAVGTPQYMSPEQAAGRLDLIGPRSDVYSLGATLYCLLTGRAPMSDRLAFDLSAILQRVQDGDIAPPRAIHGGVPKGLEAICLKAMAVRPENRYPSARRLADDLEHWLADEPISARPDTRTQFVARWVRRHRSLALATAIALLLISVVSTVATVLVNRQREVNGQLAIKNGDLAKREAAARKQAELGFQEARGAVDDLFTEVSEDTLLNAPGMQDLRKTLLKKTLDYYQRFLHQRADDPTVQDELGIAYYRAGKVIEITESAENSLAYYQNAQKIQEGLLAKSPHDPATLDALGDTYNAIGIVLNKGRRLDEARQELVKAREIRQELVTLASPKDGRFWRELANSKMNIGLVDGALNRSDDSLAEQNDAQDIRSQHLKDSSDPSKFRRDMAKGYFNLGNQELRIAQSKSDHPAEQKRHDEAAFNDFTKSSAELQKLIVDQPSDLTLKFDLATSFRLLGDSLSRSETTKSISYYQQALAAFAELADHNPKVAEYQLALAGVYMNMATRQKAPASLDSFEQAKRILEGLVKDDPGNPRFERDLAVTLLSLSERQNEVGQHDAARANLVASLAILAKLNQGLPEYQDVVQKLAEARAAMKQMDKEHPATPLTPVRPEQPAPSSTPSSL